MPCYDPPDPRPGEISDRDIINQLTALLCSAGRAYWSKKEMPQEVLIWWEHHCALDKNRGEPWDVEPKELRGE